MLILLIRSHHLSVLLSQDVDAVALHSFIFILLSVLFFLFLISSYGVSSSQYSVQVSYGL